MTNQQFTPTELENEIWKDIPGYEGHYQISNLGRIRSLDRFIKTKANYKRFQKGKILSQSVKQGYHFILLYKNSIVKMSHIHRLVALVFLEHHSVKSQINHKDGNKSNNRVQNLEWCTPKENNDHKINVLGINMRGSDHPNSILTETDIPIIRKRLRQGFSKSDIAKYFGVSRRTISNIESGIAWKHVD